MIPLPRLLLSALLLLSGFLWAEEAESVLPAAYSVVRYTAEWERSPFLREVVAPVTQTFESDFAKSIILEGIVLDDQRGTIAYARDTSSDTPLVITSEKSSSHPYTIVSAKQSNDPKDTSVIITDGKESGMIGYIAERLTQAIVQPQPAQPAPSAPDPRGKQQNPRNSSSRPPHGAPGTPPMMSPTPETPHPEGQSDISSSTETEMITDPVSALPVLDKASEPRRRRIPLPDK